MSLAAGEQLGPYKILGPLGAGGMGEVYRAHDSRLQREVAIKILPLSVAHDAAALGRLQREARAIAALNHPNLLTIFDIGTLPEGHAAAGSPFLVSEPLAGETLRAKLAGGALPQRKAIDYGAQIARGLAAAHAKGIVHRDLKPENLFCCEDGRVKVLDFGLAKVVETAAAEAETLAATSPAATAAGVVLGTMGYMSPEQARGRAADARSDIFSLGAVLYEMLSGRRAFVGESGADVLSAILREEPPELAATGRNVSPVLDRIVRHCLEKEAAQRFESAGDIAFHLQELTLGSSAAAAAPPAARTGLARRWRFALAGSAGLAVVAAITWYAARATFHAPIPQFTHLTYRQGFINSARLLPGGQGFVGVGTWDNEAQPTLFTGRLGATGLQNLGHGAVEVLAVSRGGELAVLQNFRGGFNVRYGALARMPLNGGAGRAVLDNIEAADWRAGDLARDAAIARYHPSAHNTTVEYPVGHVLDTVAAGVGDLRLSPDGSWLAFIAHFVAGDDNGRVEVVRVSNGAARD